MTCLADRVTKNVNAWKRINAPAQVISWIEFGVPLLFKANIDSVSCQANNHFMSSEQKTFVREELCRLESVGAIERCKNKPKCVSPLSCVKKKQGTWRLITDLRSVNQGLKSAHFKNDDIRTVMQLLKENDQLITVDIKDGYHHLKVRSADRDYLGISFDGKFYRWCVLPFGLSLAPYYFCKWMRCVVTYLREQALKCNSFVDDWILAASERLITDHSDMLLQTFDELGITINESKSQLTPCTSLEYIGYIVSTRNSFHAPGICIPGRRLQAVRHDINRILKAGRCKARTLAKIAGRCVSMSLAIVPGKLLLRGVYALLRSRTTWEESLQLSQDAISDLQWWQQAASAWNGRYSFTSVPDNQIFTDASSVGWGAVCQQTAAAGQWNKRIAWKSSNHRELMAVLMALMTFGPRLQGRRVEIMTDNIVTMAYINGQGGPIHELTQIAKAIWARALDHNIMLSARHVAGINNITADGLSRVHRKSEWMLHPRLFRWINRVWGPHTVDRFADYLTAQLPVYNSRYEDPYSSGVNGLAQQDWKSHNNYANPPFCLIPATLEVIAQQKAKATIIAPMWPAQPWYQTLREMSIAKPLPIPNSIRAIIAQGPNPEPRRNLGWKLFAWRVSGARA